MMEDQVSARYIRGTEKKIQRQKKIWDLGAWIQQIKQLTTDVTGAEEGKVEKEGFFFFLKYQESVFPE